MQWLPRFVIRLVIYPYLLIVITRVEGSALLAGGKSCAEEWIKESERVGSPLNLIAITPVMQAWRVW